MICPHCKKAINVNKRTKELQARVLKLHEEGFSARDIEAKLEREISFSTAARWIREKKQLELDIAELRGRCGQ